MTTSTRRRPASGTDDERPEEQPQPRAPLEQAKAETKRMVVRYRRQLTPLGVMGAATLVGVAADAASVPGNLGVLALAGVGTAVAYGRIQPRLGRWSRAYLAITCSATWCWEATAALFGARNLMWLLWFGGSAVAIPWWLRHSEKTPDIGAEESTPQPAPAPEPAQEPEPEPDWRAVRWSTHGGATNGMFPGSALSDFRETKYGWSAIVSLPRGGHWRDLTGKVDRIASWFDLCDGRALIEPIPGEPVHKARLTVLTVNPLESILKWAGPGLNIDEGTFPLALTADGEILDWRFWWPGAGMCHGLIAGTTGSGKSSTVDLVLSEIAKSDRLVPIVIDGSGGASVSDWLDHVEYKALTVEDTIELLMRVIAAMDDRFQAMTKMPFTDRKGRRRKGRKSIDPTPEIPGLVVIVDEAHRFLMDEVHGKAIRRLLEIIAQMGRKVAVSVVLATQQASVTQLGGSSVLRDMCKSGTVVALRTAERVSGGMVGSVQLPEPLHELPDRWPNGSPTQGLGYIITGRLVRSRVIYVEDPYDNAEHPTPKTLDRRTRDFLDGSAIFRAAAESAADRIGSTLSRADFDDDAVDGFITAVREALARGVAEDPVELSRATGLSWSQVKTALNELRVTT